VRIIGLILVLVGALALAYETFRGERARAGSNPPAGERTLWIPPVVAGITLVSGLILTAAAYRSKEE
jgi:hypothetical protein